MEERGQGKGNICPGTPEFLVKPLAAAAAAARNYSSAHRAPRANNVFPMTSCRSNGGEWPHRCCHPANNVEYVEYVDCR